MVCYCICNVANTNNTVNDTKSILIMSQVTGQTVRVQTITIEQF